jgi:hypothetical protein
VEIFAPGVELGIAVARFVGVVFAALGYPVFDRAFHAALFLGLVIRGFVAGRRLFAALVPFDYFDLCHKSDDARRDALAGISLVFGFCFLSGSSSIRSPGPQSSAMHIFSSVAKFIPTARSFVSRQSVV